MIVSRIENNTAVYTWCMIMDIFVVSNKEPIFIEHISPEIVYAVIMTIV
jgi:hypothetical protein